MNFGGLAGESNFVCSVLHGGFLYTVGFLSDPHQSSTACSFGAYVFEKKENSYEKFLQFAKKNLIMFRTFACYAYVIVHVLYVPHLHPFHLWHHLTHLPRHLQGTLRHRSLTLAVKCICPVNAILQGGWE